MVGSIRFPQGQATTAKQSLPADLAVALRRRALVRLLLYSSISFVIVYQVTLAE
jgi:hypothetical protein